MHSIAAALFARKDQIHFFQNIGYEHAPYTHCPLNADTWRRSRCTCNQATSFGELFLFLLNHDATLNVNDELWACVIDYDGYSCLKKWEAT